MTMDLWQLKLAARIHDPAEKALVLLRDPAGHEGGSIVGLRQELRLEIDERTKDIIRRADRSAAAADRPQFPRDATQRYPDWARVNFAEEGTLIHPLTGEVFDLRDLGERILAEHIKAVSQDLFIKLIQKVDGGGRDFRRTLLAFWRFGPELGHDLKGIGHLWSLLPADTRIPDHTIWQHLDLTSAFAGSMLDEKQPAILTVSIGPVQEFIAASRSTSDLWAGSHFLSTLAWQAMKVIAEAFGPDTIIFPQLRGVPIVDLWLIQQGVSRQLFDEYGAEWTDRNTDYNPLFGAALPNKFVAIVPANEGKKFAEKIEQCVRQWIQTEARAMLDRVLKEIDETPGGQHCYRQLESQLEGFPEVHWSLVPWMQEVEIKNALAVFHPNGHQPEFFSKIWDSLRQPIEPEAGWKFWEPNDGALYPAVHDCAELVLTAAKSVRPFQQLEQKGYRDSLTGENEWLTLNEGQLEERSPRQREDTLWARVATKKPSWAKKGEHLSAFGLIKRLWPTRYVDWLKGQGITADLSRHVVSTHVMALAPFLEKLMRDGPADEDSFRRLSQIQGVERAAIPRRLMWQEYPQHREWWDLARRLPTFIDELPEKPGSEEEQKQVEQVRKTIEKAIGIPRETYYALILMDGDKLGAWLSGEFALRFRKSFHRNVLKGMARYNDSRLRDYLELARPMSPARHMAISAALNGFSLDLVRRIVEDVCLGKLLYSGGDDVMAMVCVRDLPQALWLLRLVYSGGMPGEAGRPWPRLEKELRDVDIRRGFVRWGGRLYRAMGERATASAGAVVAHHMAPLGAVLRNLREAEAAAKHNGGRNAFSLRIIKRSGGRQDLTLPWWLGDEKNAFSTMHALETLRQAIASDISRRATYGVEEWMRDFPLLEDEKQLHTLIAENVYYQFKRKARRDAQLSTENAEKLAAIAVAESRRRLASTKKAEEKSLAHAAYEIVKGMLSTAEFLAREARGGETPQAGEPTREARHA